MLPPPTNACEAVVDPTKMPATTILGALLLRLREGNCARGPTTAGFFKDYLARGGNALLWLLLVWVTLLLARKLALLVRLWAHGRRIPGPPSTSFFFGHSKILARCGSSTDLAGYFSRAHQMYGPIVRLWLGPTQLLVSVKDPAMVEEVLLQAEDRLPLTGRTFHLAFGKSSLFVSSFEKVQKRRESLALYLHGKLLERANAIPSKVVDCVMSRIAPIISKGMLDCRLISQHLAFYVLGATLFGDLFLEWPDAHIYEELLMMVAKDGCFWASYKVPPFWRKGFWRYQLLCSRLRNLTKGFIQECRNKPDLFSKSDDSLSKQTSKISKEAELDGSSLLDDLISGDLVWEEIEKILISREEPCGNILGLMFHGCLNIASLIGSVFTRLVLFPELQEKIYSEIKQKLRANPEDPPSAQKMHLLLASIYESARLLPAGPLLQRCSLKHDLILGANVTVPSRAILVVPLQLVQMDNSVWGKDAGKFNPYRYLSKDVCDGAGPENDPLSFTTTTGLFGENKGSQSANSIQTEISNNPAFLPFGYGVRACIGQNFTIMGISALFACMLQEYEVKLQPGSEHNSDTISNDSDFQPSPSLKVVFVKRNN